LLLVLSAPCGGPRDFERADAAALAMLRGTGPLVDAARVPVERASTTPLVPWLLGAALLLALFEPVARRLWGRT
jgi:hypothetical protein